MQKILVALMLVLITSCTKVPVPVPVVPEKELPKQETPATPEPEAPKQGVKMPANCEAILKAADAGCPKPGTVYAIDMATYMDKKLADILACSGVKGVIRYYDWPGAETLKGKMPTATEMALLKSYNFEHMRVFQHFNSSLSSFTSARGKTDANHSVTQAKAAGATKGRAIYFGVDGDWYTAADQAKVKAYFAAAAPIVRDAGFRVGMYGSGSNCKMLKAAKLVDGDLCWIAASSWGWSGTKAILAENKGFTLKQKVNQKCAGKSLDYNTSLISDYGQWPLAE